MNRIFKTSFLASSLGALPFVALADDATWSGATDASWSTVTNWSSDPNPVPGAGNLATFDNAGNGNTTISLGTAITIKRIDFTGASVAAYTIGSGVDTITFSDQSDNDRNIYLDSAVTNDQIIAANIVTSDASAADIGFSNASDSSLIINGNIDTGVGGVAGTARFEFGQLFSNEQGSITMNGNISSSGGNTVQIFYGGNGVKSFNGSVASGSNFNTYILDDTTLNVGASADMGNGYVQVRNGTLNLNNTTTPQLFNEDFQLGHGDQANNTATVNIADGGVIELNTADIVYVDDSISANTGLISGGTIHISGGQQDFDIDDNVLVSGAELTITSDFTSDANNRSGIKNGAGTLYLKGRGDASSNGFNLFEIRQGTVQVDSRSNLGDNDVLLGRGSNAGTLEYLGSRGTWGVGGTTDEVRIGRDSQNVAETGGGVILNNGTGGLTFNSTLFNSSQQQDAGVTRNLTLGGANTGGVNIINGEIQNNETIAEGNQLGLVSLTKEGANTWVLNGDNTYTGATAVNDGRLDLNGTNTSAVAVAAGKTLGSRGGSTTGAVTFGAGSIIAVQGAGFSTSGALDTTAGVTVLVEEAGDGAFTVLGYGSKAGATAVGDLTLSGSGIQMSARGTGVGFADSGTAFTLDLGTEAKAWAGTVDGGWDVGSTGNWAGGSDALFYDSDLVTFGDVGSNQTVTLIEDVAPTRVTFSNASDTYTINDNGGGEALAISTGGLRVEGAANVTINAAIFGGGDIYKTGAGDLILSSANTFTGDTTVDAGFIIIEDLNALGSGLVTQNGSNVELVFNTAGGGTFANDITQTDVGNNKRLDFNLAGADTELELTGDIRFEDSQGAYRHIIELGNDMITMSGVLGGPTGFDVREAGTLKLTNAANTFGSASGSGDYITIRNDATLEVGSIANAGVDSALGRINTVRFGSGNSDGTLVYVGDGDFTDRQIRIGNSNDTTGTGGATILNNGSGALVFTNAAINIANTANTESRALTLSGSNTDDNEVQGAIIDNAATAKVGLVKAGAGKWVLSGANTYTGATTVDGGTLEINGSGNVNASSGVTVNGGSFIYNSSTNLTAGLTIVAGTVGGTNLAGVDLVVGDGVVLAPGNSTGTMASANVEWAGLGAFEFEVVDLAGPAGQGWDLLDASGALTISATSATDLFTINVKSLVGDKAIPESQADGLLDGFVDASSYTWLMASAGSIVGFAEDAFAFDTSGFQNTFTGSFRVSQVGNDLFLNYDAVPEPSAYALLAGLFAFSSIALRRRGR